MKIIDGLPLPQAILRMAIVTFVENGYEKASMDEVAARASTTKRTVYAHFGNKEELFRRALAMAVQMFQSEMPKLESTDTPAEQLEDFAVAFANLSTWKGAVRMQRVVMSEAERFGDLALMLHREIIEHAQKVVASYLQAIDRRTGGDREARSADWYDQLAKLFLNMTTGEPRFATLLQARQPFPEHPLAKTPPDVYRAAIRQAVQIFLQGTGIGHPNHRN
jgi:AcrR family transcriptional regulator